MGGISYTLSSTSFLLLCVEIFGPVLYYLAAVFSHNLFLFLLAYVSCMS